MQITKPTKAEMMRELRDYIFITVGLISYALGWALFLIPYQITTGGTTGIGAIIYYATDFPIQWSYFIINAVLMTFAIKILGPKFSIKTTFAIFGLTFFLWFFQMLVNGPDNTPPVTIRMKKNSTVPEGCSKTCAVQALESYSIATEAREERILLPLSYISIKTSHWGVWLCFAM